MSEPNPQSGDAAPSPAPSPGAPRSRSLALRLLPWAITIACFALVYFKIRQRVPDDLRVDQYLFQVFREIPWFRWLALMLPYSCLFLLVDSAVTWRVISWFNAPVRYGSILPIRASAYILSLLNEQVSKGAIALYLNRRDGIPGWEVGSSMLFIMFCEYFYLLGWAALGYALGGSGTLPAGFGLVPWLALGSAVAFAGLYAFFRGALPFGSALREKPLLRAFRRAHLGHYLGLIALRSPAMLGAVFVYTLALRLFGVQEDFSTMLSVLPVIFFAAAVPTPMRAVAFTAWTLIYPEYPAQMAAFGLVQHNFFILFNATFGLLFLRRANRELYGSAAASPGAAPS